MAKYKAGGEYMGNRDWLKNKIEYVDYAKKGIYQKLVKTTRIRKILKL